MGLLTKIADIMAIPIWLWLTLQRKKNIRRIVIWCLILVPAVFGSVFALYGPEALTAMLSALLMVIQLILSMCFMVLQFVFLFWFLSRTRATEIYPGQDNVLTFDDYWGQEHLKRNVE